ncbi:hypothetical protein D3C71_985830 [compost metagenome]
MEIVDRLEPVGGNLGELQHARLAADLEHAVHLAQAGVLVGHVAQAEGDGHQVEAGIGERQRLGIALHVLQALDQAPVHQAVAADREHAGVDVAQDHLALLTHALLDQRGDVAGATGQVQHAVARLHLRGGYVVALPRPVDAQAHQVVHQVVAARDRGEHFAHQLLLVLRSDIAEAEMGGASLVGGFAHGTIIAPLGVLRHLGAATGRRRPAPAHYHGRPYAHERCP